MKSLIKLRAGVMVLTLLLLSGVSARADVDDFVLSVRDVTHTANTIEFNLYLLDADDAQAFDFAALQLGLLLNSSIYGTGTLTVSYSNTGSGLDGDQQFVNDPDVVAPLAGYEGKTLIRLMANNIPPVPPGAGSGTVISSTGDGTLLAHFTISSTENFAPNSRAGMEFCSGAAVSPLYPTVVYSYIDGNSTALGVTPGVDAIVDGDPLLNPTLPAEFNVTGGGSYCEGGDGLPVGLDGSEADATYTLYKDEIAQPSPIPGTGAAISFGNQTEGTYEIYAANEAGSIKMDGEAVITETVLPTATIVYSGSPFCTSVTTAQPVTLSGTGAYTGGTFSASPAGLSINSETGFITPSASAPNTFTVTYTIPASGGCPAVPVTTDVTITALPVATFSYAGSPYCSNGTDPVPTYIGGGIAGEFSSTSGLVFISTTTGQVDLSASTPGTYTVTNTIAASGGCEEVIATSPITITALPTAAISYAGSPFCSSVTTAQAVTLSGTGEYTGGVFSALPAGLTINTSDGSVTPVTSLPGTYNVTYTISASGGCGVVTATAEVVVNPVPVITSVEKTDVTVCGGSDGTITIAATGYAPLTYSINGGTDFYANNGLFTGLGNGTYTVAVRNGYGCVTAGDQVTVNDGGAPSPPAAGEDATYCSGDVMEDLTATASSGGTLTWYSDPALTDVLGTGPTFTPLTTVEATNYYVTETAGGCESTSTVVTITITAVPTATITYAGSPFCTSVTTAQSVTLSGTGAYTGGSYSATPSGLSINSETGAITPATSTPNTYTVTYTIPASGGCPAVPVTTGVTITALPTANISYTGSPWCTTAGIQSVTLTGTGSYQGGTYSATPAGLTIDSNSGAITPSTSAAGNYTITYTIDASGGCADVTVTTSISVIALPQAAGNISGPVTFTPGTSGIIYSVGPISGATDYVWSYTGADVTINGTGSSVTLDFALTATAGTLSVYGSNICGDGASSSLDLIPATKTLTLTSVLLEGLYSGGGTMRQAWGETGTQWPAGIADHVLVELHNAADYSIMELSVNDIELTTSGTVSVAIPAEYSDSYYISIKHRNHIETTTALPISFSNSTVSYAFDSANKAYGDNLKRIDEAIDHFVIYGGDSNSDGVTDGLDLIDTENGAALFSSGYLSIDLNGDGIVDALDLILVENNALNFVMIILP